MSVITMKQLLEAGVHFGHRTRRWNPKMRPYIFTERSGIHIIDLQQTMLRLQEYYEMVRSLTAEGGTILFVGTKRQAQATIRQEAERCGTPYVNIRWLGGTLTNWATIKQRINYLLQLERRWDAGEFNNLIKKEQLLITREIEKLNRRIGGLKTMTKPPDMLFIVDVHSEDLAVREASKLEIPILAMVDTNSNPDPVRYIIPSNDDAIRAVKVVVSVIADAVEEGMRIREIDMIDTGQVSDADLAEMEQYLGPSTLARLQSADEDEIDDVEHDIVPEIASDITSDDFASDNGVDATNVADNTDNSQTDDVNTVDSGPVDSSPVDVSASETIAVPEEEPVVDSE
ncbi:30S ribosomal protein S2 [Chloroflexi bacterium TSY]|nr:30S ribosomal protein S2 [Chloroflexi bacterium TSY]